MVCSHMNLVEGDYFGLEFQNRQKMMVSKDGYGGNTSELSPLITSYLVIFFPHTGLVGPREAHYEAAPT